MKPEYSDLRSEFICLYQWLPANDYFAGGTLLAYNRFVI